MEKRTLIQWGFNTIALFLAALFIWAGASKIPNPAGFSNDIANFRLLPSFMAPWMSLYLPWLEITCGLLLLPRKWRNPALCILGGLLGIYIVAFVLAWCRGLDISCGCFGHSVPTKNHLHPILRNFLLLVVTTCLFKENDRRLAASNNP